jgi:hypothetical protein
MTIRNTQMRTDKMVFVGNRLYRLRRPNRMLLGEPAATFTFQAILGIDKLVYLEHEKKLFVVVRLTGFT